ncbi:MAG: hypothetical protein Q7R39_14745, partial [Dehalococcoidia bacterium]|nr:hypothetical protein [Dehalococcoidia bacterium]
FNEGQFVERASRGELGTSTLTYDTHLTYRQRVKIGEPYCTRSRMVLFSTLDGRPVALAHQYKRTNGELGASGRPDPKRIFVEGKVIAVRQSP